MAGGRPKKQIDYKMVADLANIQCTQEEIANILHISARTLQKDSEFLRIYKKGIDSGKMSLRRLQWKKANEGNTTMLVWLGKQYLGQSDKVETKDETINNEMASAIDRLVDKLDV